MRAGEFVSDSAGAALGRIESVLSAASGERLLIARAFYRDSYVVVRAGEARASETDAAGLPWHTLGVTTEDVVGRGAYRRALGKLVPDPFPMPFGQPRPDAQAQAELQAALRDDPLTTGGEIELRVMNGVVVLEGLIGTVGGKVAAERLARTTPGIWEAVNRLFSDEELLGAVRAALRRAGRVADAVEDVRVARGTVTVTLLPGEGGAESEVERVCAAVDGVRSVVVERAP